MFILVTSVNLIFFPLFFTSNYRRQSIFMHISKHHIRIRARPFRFSIFSHNDGQISPSSNFSYLLNSPRSIWAEFYRGNQLFLRLGLEGLLLLRSIQLWKGSYWCTGNGFPPGSSPLPPGCGSQRASLHTWSLTSLSPWWYKNILPLCALRPPLYPCFFTTSAILFMADRCIRLTILRPAPLWASRAALLQDSSQAGLRVVTLQALLGRATMLRGHRTGVRSWLGKAYLTGF